MIRVPRHAQISYWPSAVQPGYPEHNGQRHQASRDPHIGAGDLLLRVNLLLPRPHARIRSATTASIPAPVLRARPSCIQLPVPIRC